MRVSNRVEQIIRRSCFGQLQRGQEERRSERGWTRRRSKEEKKRDEKRFEARQRRERAWDTRRECSKVINFGTVAAV